MKRFYIYRDGIQLGSTVSRESAVDLIHQYQAYETHPILRAQFSMIEGEEEFIPYGVNTLRLRLWNDPYSPKGEPYGAGSCDLDCVTALAKRAKAMGFDWLLDLHYSDFWADPGKQTIPKAWQGLGEEELAQAVGSYTAQVLEALKEAGVPPQMVSVGNELSYGLLWPTGKTPRYGAITRLVSAGVEAVRAFDPALPVMLHLDNGGNNALYREWRPCWARDNVTYCTSASKAAAWWQNKSLRGRNKSWQS